jgi:hypothetical protein
MIRGRLIVWDVSEKEVVRNGLFQIIEIIGVFPIEELELAELCALHDTPSFGFLQYTTSASHLASPSHIAPAFTGFSPHEPFIPARLISQMGAKG